jgi:hypothetical protein
MQRIARFARGNGIALLALFVALGGTGYAASKLPKNSVTAKQIKKNAVGASEIKAGAVGTSEVKNQSLLATDFESGQLPAGATGPQGPQGAQGAAGSAVAFAYVNRNDCPAGPPPISCPVAKGKNVTGIRRISSGVYCITVTGATPATSVAMAAVEYQGTAGPETPTSAETSNAGSGSCPNGPSDFVVRTQRMDTVAVEDDPAADGSETVTDNGDDVADNVSFNFVVF